MGLTVICPRCGPRDYTEFACDGELRPDPFQAPVTGQALWGRANLDGRQEERWFHELGCRRWFTLTRDTRTNEVDALV